MEKIIKEMHLENLTPEEQVHKLSKELEKYRWVPIEEELPDERKYVEVTIKRYNSFYPEIARTFLRKGEWDCEDEITKVIAWRPLTQPYRDGKGIWGADYK